MWSPALLLPHLSDDGYATTAADGSDGDATASDGYVTPGGPTGVARTRSGLADWYLLARRLAGRWSAVV